MKYLASVVLAVMASTNAHADDVRQGTAVLGGIMEQLPGVLENIQRRNRLLEEKMGEQGVAVSRLESDPGSQEAGHSLDRDPFAISPLMDQEAALQGRGMRFTPLAPGGKTPELKLRGIVNGRDGGRVALLDVGGAEVYLVREGDTISLHNAGRNTVIKIKEVSHLSLLAEVGTLGEVIIVR